MIIRSVQIAIVGLVSIAITSMVIKFDSTIVSACIAAITSVLVGNKYLESRPASAAGPPVH